MVILIKSNLVIILKYRWFILSSYFIRIENELMYVLF